MTKLALCIAKNEGYFVPGTMPNKRNNPGDLRHSPHSTHLDPNKPDDIGTIDTPAHGWEDLERQLLIYSRRTITTDPQTHRPCSPRLMNLSDLAYTYAPPADNNPTSAYLDSLCKGLGIAATTSVAVALLIPADTPAPPSTFT